MNNNEFSVLMCVYYKDNSNSFEKALKSIINQTVRPNEINIVCDGPLTDKLYDIINQYKAKYSLINVYEIEKNVGHGKARKYGIEQCKYNIVALMDSDDISVKDRFEKQLKVFDENKNIHVVGGQIYEFMDDTENIVGKREVPELDKDIKKYMRKRCPMNQVTVMFDKKAVIDSGNYIDWYCEEDYYLWIRMAQHNYNFYNIQCNLVFVRVGNEMYSRRGGFRYYKSERRVQRYMLKNKIISFPLYLYNIALRFIVQILLSNGLRGFVFRTFARKNNSKK